MSERETDNSTGGNSTGGRETDRAGGDGRPEQDHERDKDEFEAGTGYQPSTNQAQDEPLPASHHDDGGQETARRGEPVRDPSPHGQDHEEE